VNLTRRELLAMSAFALARCESMEGIPAGRLTARPPTRADSLGPGLHRLELQRDTLLYIPMRATGAFALLLHGANGQPERVLDRFRDVADESGVILLAPKSRDATWDAIHGNFAIDLPFLGAALTAAFARCNVDRAHLAVAGFSDGATLAVALGLANGDLFSHVIAFSPGFLIPLRRVGAARFFLSHGTADPILPIDHASRAIARDLRRAHLDVLLREFDGGHTVPPNIAQEAFAWFTR
jgi:phospholipase/carboxylesterase